MKAAGIILGGIVFLILLMFILEYAGLGFTAFFEPKKENIRRNVFEETQSYVQGKNQDLAKDYKEWMETTPDNRVVIENVVREQFANYKIKNIESVVLQNWLTKVRGY